MLSASIREIRERKYNECYQRQSAKSARENIMNVISVNPRNQREKNIMNVISVNPRNPREKI
ncbi:MAG: hypothetical protein KatS3mg028_1311 [Bacteroidia bacterium]|nr:MAG: hypothetical protein KatS3mg028_1311 [Bacteroidia bacterium]